MSHYIALVNYTDKGIANVNRFIREPGHIVNLGSIAGFDPATGERRWSVGDDRVQ